MLPRALYTSVFLVIAIYLAVSLTVTGNLSTSRSSAPRTTRSRKPRAVPRRVRLRLIAIAALFSTASAINATLFGSANVCCMIARDGELPVGLSRTEWKGATNGCCSPPPCRAGDVGLRPPGIAMVGLAFLPVYAAVNAGHLRVLEQTGANAIIVWLSLITNLSCSSFWASTPGSAARRDRGASSYLRSLVRRRMDSTAGPGDQGRCVVFDSDVCIHHSGREFDQAEVENPESTCPGR
jgi:amino acid transporter